MCKWRPWRRPPRSLASKPWVPGAAAVYFWASRTPVRAPVNRAAVRLQSSSPRAQRVYKFEGVAQREGKTTCDCEFTAMIADPPADGGRGNSRRAPLMRRFPTCPAVGTGHMQDETRHEGRTHPDTTPSTSNDDGTDSRRAPHGARRRHDDARSTPQPPGLDRARVRCRKAACGGVQQAFGGLASRVSASSANKRGAVRGAALSFALAVAVTRHRRPRPRIFALRADRVDHRGGVSAELGSCLPRGRATRVSRISPIPRFVTPSAVPNRRRRQSRTRCKLLLGICYQRQLTPAFPTVAVLTTTCCSRSGS